MPFATGMRDSPPLDGISGIDGGGGGGGGGGRRGDGDSKHCGDNISVDTVPPLLDTSPGLAEAD